MNAVGYLRELPDPEPDLTLEAQQRAYLDACARLGLSVGPVFTDLEADAEGDEGAPDPELRRMLRRLMLDGQHRFTTVVAASPRVLGATARARIRRMLQLAALGLPVRFADGADPDRALLEEWAGRAPEERRRERAIEGMRRRALRGEVLGRSPYGYRIAGRRLEPDEAEAPVVRRIFRLYVEDGEGVRRIAGRLNADGLRTRRGGPWSMVTVRDLLRNPVYTGTYRRLGVTIPKAHEALVTRDDFEAVQRRMAARRTSGGPQERREYLLAGLAFCGHCGNNLVGMTRRRTAEEGGVHRYYQCQSMTNQSRCGYHTRRADELEAEVHAALVEDRVSRHPLLGEARTVADAETARRLALQRDLDRMVERRALGQWTADQLRTNAAPLVLAQLAAEERASAATATSEAAPFEDARRRLIGEWARLTAPQRRALLLQVVSEVVVTDEAVRVAVAG